jgi:hypothetical protein
MSNQPDQYTETEYDSFLECVAEPWEPLREPDQRHDIVINHPEGRQIRIDSARKRISCRRRSDDHWGLRERKVSDLQRAAEQLMTVGMLVEMTELWTLGLDGHPKPPDEIPAWND